MENPKYTVSYNADLLPVIDVDVHTDDEPTQVFPTQPQQEQQENEE